MADPLTSFERAVLDALLAGDDARLEPLRAQAAACTASARRSTGVGCLVELAVPAELPRASPPAMTLADIDLQLEGQEEGTTAMAFVRRGALVLLEFVSHAGHWPEHPVTQRLGYLRYQPAPAGGYTLLPSTHRDPDTLALQLAGHKSAR